MEPFQLEVQVAPGHGNPPLPRKKPVGGLDVPDDPIAPVGCFYDYDSWVSYHYGLLEPHTFVSARNAEVFEVKPLGPRGGKYYAIASEEAWRTWAKEYKRRVDLRTVREAARRLGYDYTKRRAR